MTADFSDYPHQKLGWLVDRLAVVVSELHNGYIVQASTQAEEKRARVQAFLTSSEPTVAGRERAAEAQSMHITIALYETNGRIKALTEERDLLRLLLDAEPPT